MSSSSSVVQAGPRVTFHVPSISAVAAAPKFRKSAARPPRVVSHAHALGPQATALNLLEKFAAIKEEYGNQAEKYVDAVDHLSEMLLVPKVRRDGAWLKTCRRDTLDAESAQFLMGRLILARELVKTAWVDNNMPGSVPALGYARLQGPYK